MGNNAEILPVGGEPQENGGCGPKRNILDTLKVTVIGTRLCETAGNNESGEGVRRYTEFHDEDIDIGCSRQKRIDELWDRAEKARKAGDYKAYNDYKKQIENLEEVPLIEALKK